MKNIITSVNELTNKPPHDLKYGLVDNENTLTDKLCSRYVISSWIICNSSHNLQWLLISIFSTDLLICMMFFCMRQRLWANHPRALRIPLPRSCKISCRVLLSVSRVSHFARPRVDESSAIHVCVSVASLGQKNLLILWGIVQKWACL